MVILPVSTSVSSIGAPIQVPAALPSILLPVDVPGKVVEDDLTTWSQTLMWETWVNCVAEAWPSPDH